MHDYKSNISYLIDYKTGLDYSRISVAPAGYDYQLAEIDSFEFDTSTAAGIAVCKIDATHFLIIYAGGSSYGQIRTYSVDENYDTITLVDSLQPETSNGSQNSVAQLSATLYVNAYTGEGEDGYVRTITMDSNADNLAVAATLEHDTAQGYSSTVVAIDSTHFMIAYNSGAGWDGYIKTFSCAANGTSITEIASLKYDDGMFAGYYAGSLVKIDGTHFILATNDTNTDGFLRTFSIDVNFQNITEIDNFEFDTANCANASLVKIDATHYACAFSGTDSDGFLKTFSIDANANNITEIDSLEFDTTSALFNSMALIDSTHLILAYAGVDSDGFIKTFGFDGAYDNLTELESIEHDTANGTVNAIAQLAIDKYVLAYVGADGDGFVKTFGMT